MNYHLYHGSFHVKSSRPFNPPSQKWLNVGVQVLPKVLNNYTKPYFIWTGTSWDIGQWILLIKSHFFPTWRLATSLVIPKLEYLQTCELKIYILIDFGMENLKITLTMYRNVTFESYNWIMLPYFRNVRIYLPCC